MSPQETMRDLSNCSTTVSIDQSTIPGGHEAILEMHANSESNAILYVIVVLVLYAVALVVVMIKYVKTEQYESRLSRLYDEFLKKDRLIRLTKRKATIRQEHLPNASCEGATRTVLTPINDHIPMDTKV